MSFFTAKKISNGLQSSEQLSESTPLPVDVFQQDGKLVILAPIAGVTIDDISVSISDDILTISGERVKTETLDLQDYFSQECYWGEFSRSIVLPINVDTQKVTAFYKRGILRIEMPMLEGEKMRVIPVKVTEES